MCGETHCGERCGDTGFMVWWRVNSSYLISYVWWVQDLNNISRYWFRVIILSDNTIEWSDLQWNKYLKKTRVNNSCTETQTLSFAVGLLLYKEVVIRIYHISNVVYKFCMTSYNASVYITYFSWHSSLVMFVYIILESWSAWQQWLLLK